MPESVAYPDPAPWLLPGALLAASLAASLWLALPPTAGAGEPVAALFPPWWSPAESLSAAAAAGGAVLRAGPSGLVVARSSAPGFEARLREAGAWLLFDPRGLGLCTSRR